MSYLLPQLVDMADLQAIIDSFYATSQISMGIIDRQGKILAATEWKRICSDFHRANPETLKRCLHNDIHACDDTNGRPRLDYKCPNGLRGVAMPIVVEGDHLATLLLGQFFFDDDTIDREFFARQAERHGFDRKAYLAALDEVPRFSREKLKHVQDYYFRLVKFISAQGLANLRLKEEMERRRDVERELNRRLDLLGLIRALNDAIPNPVFYKDMEMTFQGCNPAFEKLTGMERSEIIGRKAEELFPPGPAEIFTQKDLELIEKGGLQSYEILTEQLPSNGVEACIINKALHLSDSGEPVGIVGVLTDITEREETKRRLERSEERYRYLVESLQEGIWQCDAQGIMVFANSPLTEMLGYTPEEMRGARLSNYMAPESQIRFRRKVAEESWEDFRLEEYSFIRKDGQTVIALVSGSTVHDSQGRKVGALATVTDITQRRRSEQDYKALFTRMLNGFALFEVINDDDGNPMDYRYLAMNPAFERLVGVSSCDFVGNTVLKLHPHVDKSWLKSASEVARTREPVSFVNLPQADGRCFQLVLYVPTPGQLAVILSDVAEQKLASDMLRQDKAKAEAANRAKDEFLANMSHEIRTPLNGVFGMLQLLEGTPLTEEQQQYVATALESGTSLVTIIDDILDFSRMEAGKLLLGSEPFHLDEVLRVLMANFRIEADRKNLKFSLKLDPAVPKLVTGDPGRLRQVLFNLAGNAIKFTEEGEVSVTVSPGEEREMVCVEVRDTGIGISPEMRERVFEPFFQVDGSFKRSYAGTGLGLGIVKKLVTSMGGRIEILSPREGKGVCFRVSLPLPAAKESGGDASDMEDLALQQSPQTVLRVLVAEDDRVNQITARGMLERLGHEVHCVANGVEALAALQSADYDAVLMDVQMPVMDGIEATRAIRGMEGEPSQVPIIALTAHAVKGDRELFLASGMNAYLPKPVDIRELRRLLQSLKE